MYQSVLARARQTTVTSCRIPATSWAHHSGKGVVVTVGEKDAVGRNGVEQIVGQVGGQPGIGPLAPGRSAPVQGHRQQRNQKRAGRQSPGGRPAES